MLSGCIRVITSSTNELYFFSESLWFYIVLQKLENDQK